MKDLKTIIAAKNLLMFFVVLAVGTSYWNHHATGRFHVTLLLGMVFCYEVLTDGIVHGIGELSETDNESHAPTV